MNYLNVKNPFISFQRVLRNRAFVDKSLLIEEINCQMEQGNSYICITKPRRFGKTVNASMLGAYYTKGFDNSDLFKGLAVESVDSYWEHLNQHNVVYINFSDFWGNCKSYDDYIRDIEKKLREDVLQYYAIDAEDRSLSYILEQTDDSFIFILDEWDSIFYESFMTKDDRIKYLKFLKALLKDRSYVELAYMTGILPIDKYSSGSELNMFERYSFIDDDLFDHYFGFTELEVKKLCERFHTLSFNELKEWYDGYTTVDGESLFNPHSVCSALGRGRCRNYWTETGPMNEIADCIRHNVDAVRDDVINLVAGNVIELKKDLGDYSALEQQMNTREQILSAMVVFGFLSYSNRTLRIPNKELMLKFQLVLERGMFSEVKAIIDRSNELLESTLAKDSKKVAEIIEDVHDLEIPILKYSDENSLSCVVSLCYLYARNYYKIEREKKAGKGLCDFIFYPRVKGYPGIILELKYGGTCDQALDQIKQRNYVQELRNCHEVLLVGINYSKKEKIHECKIECVQQASLSTDLEDMDAFNQ